LVLMVLALETLVVADPREYQVGEEIKMRR
jgi:hypothetical protein